MNDPVLVIACGALAREISAVKRKYGWSHLHLKCLDPLLHNRPERIAGEIRVAVEQYRDKYARIFIGYADCGTAGAIDAVIRDYAIDRLPGVHCYQLFAGASRFEQMSDDDPGGFYLTDFLARNFRKLVIDPLRLDEFPEHIGIYFRNYSRVVYLSQNPSQGLLAAARNAATTLRLPFEHLHCGYGELQQKLVSVMAE